MAEFCSRCSKAVLNTKAQRHEGTNFVPSRLCAFVVRPLPVRPSDNAQPDQ